MMSLCLAFGLGAALQIIALLIFWWAARVSRAEINRGPISGAIPVSGSAVNCKQALKNFYLAEALRFITILIGFSLIWLYYPHHPLATLIGFFIPQLAYWICSLGGLF